MKKTIAILAGDGIGPEIMLAAISILRRIAEKFKHDFTFVEAAIGGHAFEKHGQHFPEETKHICQQADAVLFGSVGGPLHEAHLPKWKNCEKNSILALRKAFTLNANLRPVTVYPELMDISPLKNNVIEQGIDLLIIRELIGDIYFGEHKTWQQEGKRVARDVAEYTEDQIVAVAARGFQMARNRRQKLTSVDKANVLDTSRLWRAIVTEMSQDYPDVTLEHMLVDNCAMQLTLNPRQFDVILTANLFGDILSDAAAALPGSLGLMSSASLNANGFGLYEPSGGTAPGIAGKNIANPMAQILSASLLLRYSFELQKEAMAVENAVQKTLQAGFRTADLVVSGGSAIGTKEIAEKILGYI